MLAHYKTVNWNLEAEKAVALSDSGLIDVINDYLCSLQTDDKHDREHGTDFGGYTRDVISVYRTEVRLRERSKKCECCGHYLSSKRRTTQR